MAKIRRGYCRGCPYDYGQPATELAYNLGCLPTPGEIRDKVGPSLAWACHDEPDKVCCGYATTDHNATTKPLYIEAGVHGAE